MAERRAAPPRLPLLATLFAATLLAIAGCKPTPTEAPAPPDTARVKVSPALAYSHEIRPLEVCEHLARMVAGEAGISSAQFDPAMMQDCERDMTIEASLRGSDNWNGLAGCVLSTRTEADLQACDRDHPLPAGTSVGDEGRSDEGRERLACENMIEIIMRESPEPLGSELSEADRNDLVSGCVSTLIRDQGATLSPEDYAGLLACLGAAQTDADIQAC